MIYTDTDIERLQLLQRATEGGHGIGHIANLPTEALVRLLADDRAAGVSTPRPDRAASASGEPWVERCLAAVERLDSEDLERQLAQAAVALSQPQLLQTVIEPLMQHIGDRWRQGTLRIADEHMASAVIRTFVGSLGSAYRPSASAPRILVATPIGQTHEIGALMAAHMAAADGWRVVYLGPNLPAAEIAGAALQTEARAVALSIIYPGDDPSLSADLVKLGNLLPDEVRILAGGQSAPQYREALDRIGAMVPADLEDFRNQLEDLRQAQIAAAPATK